jgi:hypothetical protein
LAGEQYEVLRQADAESARLALTYESTIEPPFRRVVYAARTLIVFPGGSETCRGQIGKPAAVPLRRRSRIAVRTSPLVMVGDSEVKPRGQRSGDEAVRSD